MNRFYCFLALLIFAFNATVGQLLDPVVWKTSVEKINDNEYWLISRASIDAGWHLYAQVVPEDGPIATYFEYNNSDAYALLGETLEPEGITVFDSVWEKDIKYFENDVLFKQKVNWDGQGTITGFVEYMVCDDRQCLAPTSEDLVFTLSKISQNTTTAATGNANNDAVNKKLFGLTTTDLNKEALQSNNDGEGPASTVSANSNLWSIFGLGFLGGLLALLTPCVFPMIPLTVSFFTKQNQSKSGTAQALLYGFFIVLVYAILSVPFHLLDSVNPAILNEISTNVTLNIIFFLVFLFFAFSFFGFYELTLPASWTAKSTKAENVGGIVGVFFMALTLALVSFSCTGPILGSLLAGSLTADGGAWQLTSGMLGFGVALGLPFTFFALFPSVLAKLPKSGGWMVTVKIVLGFLELASALNFYPMPI